MIESLEHRTEYWSEKKQMFRGVVPTQISSDNDNECISYAKEYYTKYYNEEVSNLKLLSSIWSVDALCKRFNCKVIQFLPIGMDNMNWDGNNLNSKYPLLNHEMNRLPNSFLDTKVIRDLVDNKMHPTEKGHKDLAEYLVTYFLPETKHFADDFHEGKME